MARGETEPSDLSAPAPGERLRDEPAPGESTRLVEGQLYFAGLTPEEQLPLCSAGRALGYDVMPLETGARLLEDGRFVVVVVGAQSLDDARVRLAFVQSQGPTPVLLVAEPELLAAALAAELPFDEGLVTPVTTQELSSRLRSLRRLESFTRASLGAERLASVGRVAAGVAGELAGPLACVRSNLIAAVPELRELGDLARNLRPSDPQGAIRLEEVAGQLRDLIAESRDEVERMLSLVRDVRTFTAPRGGVPGPCDLLCCVESSLSLLRTLVSGPVRVTRELLQLPPVVAEAGQVIQVVVSLLLHAAASGRPDGRLTVRTRSAGWLAVVEVEREGGLPDAASLGSLLREAPPAPGSQPAGLGLLLAADTARGLGGDLSAQSGAGEAVKLVLRLPLAPAQGRSARS